MQVNSVNQLNDGTSGSSFYKTPVNSRWINAYAICDYVPLVSTITNASNIVAKILVKWIPPAESDSVGHLYVTHIKYKSMGQCIRLMLPVLNIAFAIHHSSNQRYDNAEWMLDAIKKDSSQIQFLSPRLKADKNFMLSVVRYDGCLIKHADPCLSSDPELIQTACEQNMHAFICVSKKEQPGLIVGRLKTSMSFLDSFQDIGVDFNVQNELGQTALIDATVNGHESIVAALIKAGANLDLQDEIGNTALMYAVASGEGSIAAALIGAGADLDLQNQQSITALMSATKNGDESIVAALIAAGASVDLQDELGNTALIYAGVDGHESILAALIKAAADPNILSYKKNRSALAYISMVRPQGWRNSKKILLPEMEKTAQGRELIALNKDVNYRILLAHAWEIQGSVNVVVSEKNRTFNLEGFHFPKILSKIVKHTGLFLESDFRWGVEDINRGMFDSLIETYTYSGTHKLKSLDARALLNRWNDRKPVLIPTGYVGHAITILLWCEYLVICNRGGDDPTIKIHLFDREVNQLETDDIKSLIKVQQLEKNNWTLTIANLSKKLKSTPVPSLEKALLSYLPAQKVGNCTYASSEGMAFIFLALSYLKPGEKKYPDGIVRDIIYPLFSEWRDFQRLRFLRRYLTYLESKEFDIKDGERVFLKTLLSEGVRREPSFLNWNVFWAPNQIKAWKTEKRRIQAIL
jgi:ankyrin repeat protein